MFVYLAIYKLGVVGIALTLTANLLLRYYFGKRAAGMRKPNFREHL